MEFVHLPCAYMNVCSLAFSYTKCIVSITWTTWYFTLINRKYRSNEEWSPVAFFFSFSFPSSTLLLFHLSRPPWHQFFCSSLSSSVRHFNYLSLNHQIPLFFTLFLLLYCFTLFLRFVLLKLSSRSPFLSMRPVLSCLRSVQLISLNFINFFKY